MPPGTAITPFDDAFDARLLAARNVISADHRDSLPMTARTRRHTITRSPHFRPESSFLLLSEHEREILCYLMCTELTDTPTDRELHLANAGTRPALHGRGLYRAVFTHTLTQARAQDHRRAALDIDSKNPTATGGFYERMALQRLRTWTTHVHAPSATAPPPAPSASPQVPAPTGLPGPKSVRLPRRRPFGVLAASVR
ncbi:GNAT family N-acetyltransferase [Streptomyces uncialis]|uniref:GNAT family N-acetyltransferase n=1 Tax=Streptomyces uncialis TaxID=1048205 RepID=UPI00365E3F33